MGIEKTTFVTNTSRVVHLGKPEDQKLGKIKDIVPTHGDSIPEPTTNQKRALWTKVKHSRFL